VAFADVPKQKSRHPRNPYLLKPSSPGPPRAEGRTGYHSADSSAETQLRRDPDNTFSCAAAPLRENVLVAQRPRHESLCPRPEAGRGYWASTVQPSWPASFFIGSVCLAQPQSSGYGSAALAPSSTTSSRRTCAPSSSLSADGLCFQKAKSDRLLVSGNPPTCARSTRKCPQKTRQNSRVCGCLPASPAGV